MPEMTPQRTVDALIEKFVNDQGLIDRIRTDPLATLEAVGAEVKRENPVRAPDDKFTYRIAVIALSVVVIAVMGGVIFKWLFLSTGDFKIPEMLVAMGSTALGALAGLLMPNGAGAR